MTLSSRTAIVTGGSRGIGKAIATSLAEAGASIVLCGRDEAALSAAEREISSNGGSARAVVADVTRADDVSTLVRTAEEAFGRVDILINNAGVTRDGLLMRMGEADWDTVLEINLKGAFHCTKAVLRGMLKRRYGRIINVSSVSGMMGNAGQANYAASKAGLLGFTKSVAREVASRGITVNAVAPGFIRTEMTTELTEAQRDRAQSQIPIGRFGEVEEIAHAVCFLASDESRYITGQTLAVDGGMAM